MPFEHADEISFGLSSRYAESRRCQGRMPPDRRARVGVGHIRQMIEMKRAGNCIFPERVASPREVRVDLRERGGGKACAPA